jgi:hypothetical protein
MLRSPVRCLIAAALLLAALSPVSAQQWQWFSEGIFLNLPVSWKNLKLTDKRAIFTNQAEEVFYEFRRYTGDTYKEAAEMDRRLREGFGDSGKGESFRYRNRAALYGSVDFSREGQRYYGYLLVLEGDREDLAALAYVEYPLRDVYRPMLHSAVDALALGESGLINPGPVSIFNAPQQTEDGELASIDFNGESLPMVHSPSEAKASQDFIEREAEVLNIYGGTRYADAAWRRYYRLIYRDLYSRLGPVYTALRQHIPRKKYSDRELAQLLLDWVQGFRYTKTGSLSDLLSPVAGAPLSEGDCDSRGLLYVVLLHRFDVDAILMVSYRYKHSVAAVDVPGEGARFPYNDKKYLIAETTKDVSLGRIAQSMSEIEGWLGIDFLRPGGE